MCNVIFVDPRGNAHTIDEAHKTALFANEHRETLIERWENVREQIIAIWETIKPAVEKMAEQFQGAIAVFEEITVDADRLEKENQRGVTNWDWVQIRHNQNVVCHLKRGSKQQTSFIKSRRWQRSRRYQHRRGI